MNIDCEENKEKMFLSKIDNLSIDLINYIYEFLPPNIRIFCNKKFDFLESKFVNEYNDGYLLWKKCGELFQSLETKHVIDFINSKCIKNNDLIMEKIWYSALGKNTICYNGEKVINLWKQGILDPECTKNGSGSIDDKIKNRLRNAIYYYIFRTIEQYKIFKRKILLNKNVDFQLIQNVITNIEKSFYIYKTLTYISFVLNQTII
jgi:hypothetical protein